MDTGAIIERLKRSLPLTADERWLEYINRASTAGVITPEERASLSGVLRAMGIHDDIIPWDISEYGQAMGALTQEDSDLLNDALEAAKDYGYEADQGNAGDAHDAEQRYVAAATRLARRLAGEHAE